LVTSKEEYDIDLIGPARLDTSWQAQSKDGFELASFTIDWQQQQVICPTEHTNVAWHPKIEAGDEVIEVRFAASDCKLCPLRMQCTRSQKSPRLLKLRPQIQHEALQIARTRQLTTEFKQQYRQRSGIEGAFSQGCLRFDRANFRF